MENYLGEFAIPIEQTPFADFTPADWALHYIACYGGIDGAHHKAWVLDQIARILHGARVIVTQARWADGDTEWRHAVDKAPLVYQDWITTITNNGAYAYDKGIAP